MLNRIQNSYLKTHGMVFQGLRSILELPQQSDFWKIHDAFFVILGYPLLRSYTLHSWVLHGADDENRIASRPTLN